VKQVIASNPQLVLKHTERRTQKVTEKLNNLESEEIIQEEAIKESKRRLASALKKLQRIHPSNNQQFTLQKNEGQNHEFQQSHVKSSLKEILNASSGKTNVPIVVVTAMATTMSAEQAEIASLRRRLRALARKIPKSKPVHRSVPRSSTAASISSILRPVNPVLSCGMHDRNCSGCNTSCGQHSTATTLVGASAQHAALLKLAKKVAKILLRTRPTLPALLSNRTAGLSRARPTNATRAAAAAPVDPALERIAEEVVQRKERSLELEERAMRRRMRQMRHWSNHLVHGAHAQMRTRARAHGVMHSGPPPTGALSTRARVAAAASRNRPDSHCSC
jgi:hypothetical protein